MSISGLLSTDKETGFIMIEDKKYKFKISIDEFNDDGLWFIKHVNPISLSDEELYKEYNFDPFESEKADLLLAENVKGLIEFYKRHPEKLDLYDLKNSVRLFPVIKEFFTPKTLLDDLLENKYQIGSDYFNFVIDYTKESLP